MCHAQVLTRIYDMTAEAFAFAMELSEELHKPFEFCLFKIMKSRVLIL